MKKLIILMEWSLAYISIALCGLSLLFVMFTDSPAFEAKLTALQKSAFNVQGLVCVVIFAIVIGSSNLAAIR